MAYVGFVDPSGGRSDSMTLGIAHAEGERVFLDAIRETRAPFVPAEVVTAFAAVLRSYKITKIFGDRYSAEWVADAFRREGIVYRACEFTKSELYLEALPRLNSRAVVLLDHPKLIAQLASLERRRGRGQRESIDHPTGGHDDVANAAVGAIVMAGKRKSALPMFEQPRRPVFIPLFQR
jgi:hypothetical protein